MQTPASDKTSATAEEKLEILAEIIRPGDQCSMMLGPVGWPEEARKKKYTDAAQLLYKHWRDAIHAANSVRQEPYHFVDKDPWPFLVIDAVCMAFSRIRLASHSGPGSDIRPYEPIEEAYVRRYLQKPRDGQLWLTF